MIFIEYQDVAEEHQDGSEENQTNEEDMTSAVPLPEVPTAEPISISEEWTETHTVRTLDDELQPFLQDEDDMAEDIHELDYDDEYISPEQLLLAVDRILARVATVDERSPKDDMAEDIQEMETTAEPFVFPEHFLIAVDRIMARYQAM